MKKILLIILVFIFGYSVVSYKFSRSQLEDEINDYQREISIAIRLLDEYSTNCTKNNFSSYVEHSTTRYQNLVIKVHSFPYFFNHNFTKNHEESIFNFQEKITVNRNIIGACT